MVRSVALDAGQSGVRARVLDDTTREGVDLAGHPGIRTDLPLAVQLSGVVATIASDIGSIDAVAVGSTGLTGSEDLSGFDALAPLGVKTVLLAHDSITSYLGALGASRGAVIASGTGVVTLAVGESAVARVDGWGNIMGDAGSGYWFGRAALDAAMRAYDGRGAPTVLLDRLRDEFGDIEDAYIELQADPERVRRTASYSRWVTEAADEGDAVAIEVCRRGAAELALSAVSGLERVGIDSTVPTPVCTIGGVFLSETIKTAFEAEVRARRHAVRHVVANGDGLDGAAALFLLDAENPLLGRVTRLTLS